MEDDTQHAAPGIPVPIPEETLAGFTVADIKAELKGREVSFKSKMRKQELLDLLKQSLHKPVVANIPTTANKRSSKNAKTKFNGKWDDNNLAMELIYDEIKAGNVPLDEDEMGPAEIYFRYSSCAEFQGIDCNSAFIHHIHELRTAIIEECPTLAWNDDHPAKRLILDELKSGSIPLDAEDMGPAEVCYNCSDTLQFKLKGMEYGPTFQRRPRDLRKQVKANRSRAVDDAEAFKRALRNHPPPRYTHQGRLQWNGSEAQRLLKEDVAAGKHKQQKPQDLWLSREQHQETLSLDAFRWKIAQVKRTEKYLCALEHDAALKLKKHLKGMTLGR